MRLYYRLITKEPLVLSQNTATTNNHMGLDYIPGSALLGAFASRIYNQLAPAESFAIFHSGACRFGPAYPLVNDEIALPVPASWHGMKLDASILTNHAASDFQQDEALQYKQRREGYISHQGDEAKIEQGLTTRTALGDDLRAKSGQLYTYTLLEADQTYAGWIDADSEALLDRIKPLLNGELSIGRSRSSEFGRVVLECPAQQPAQAQPVNLKNMLVMWCLSDAQCFDELGNPTYKPSPGQLHPELQGQLDHAKSFIRTRKVRRFNRARNGLDSEQMLIAAGSVLTYRLNTPVANEVLQVLANQGIGSSRQQGLGWVQINPAWATQARPQGTLFSPIILSASARKAVAIPVTPLIRWAKHHLQDSQRSQTAGETIAKLHQRILAAYKNARTYNNLPDAAQAGPGSSQWRRLDDLVKNHERWADFAFSGEAAVCKAQNDELGWGLSWQEQNRYITFADFIKNKLGTLDSLTMRSLLEQLCRYDLSTHHGLLAYEQLVQPAQRRERA